MPLIDQLKSAMKDAMRAKEKTRLGTIRMVLAAVKQREIDDKIVLDDTGILSVITKAVKQRKDSIAQFKDAGRDDLVAIEEAEMAVLEDFMPQALTQAELDELINSTLADTGAAGMQDMGKVMAALKPLVQGRTDMGALSALIRNKLN